MTTPQAIDLPYLRQWVGKQHTSTDTLSLRHARLMAATVGTNPENLLASDPLPPLWHWLYFLEGLPPEQLGPDGHPARGGFLPPVPLPNRMWAGGRVTFEAPLRLGVRARKQSTITAVEHKAGRSGDLVFVTVRHEIFDGGQRLIHEEQDLVYRDPPPPAAPGAPGAAARPQVCRPSTNSSH